MSKKIVTLGSCYVDINSMNFPFDGSGIAVSQEVVGGDYELVAGGSAVNFCRRVGELGVLRASFFGVAGRDAMGDTLGNLLEQDGIKSYLDKRDGLQTGVSFNMTGVTGEHVLCVVGTSNQSMDETVIPKLAEALDGSEYLYLGGAFKLKKLAGHLQGIAKMAHAKGVKVIVDHARVPARTSAEMREAVKGLVRASDIYFPSRDEFCDVWGVQSIEEGIGLLAERAPNLTVVVKDGADPVYYRSPGEQGVVHPPVVEKIGDVTGAGDTFNAAVISSLAGGTSLRESIEFGCKVASEKVAA